MTNAPFVSIIIPCRNEEKYIGKCLDSVVAQDFSKESLEVLIVDGASEDRTREIIGEYIKQYPFIKLLENPKKFTPFGLNIGVKAVKGDVVIRMDAHAGYKMDYVAKCVYFLQETKADNVGGVIKTMPAKDTAMARAIAISLSHFFGAGNAFFRTGSEKIREADTVFGGCFKKDIFTKIGFFNEKLKRSQDIEFNKRLKKAGGKIVLVPEIQAVYYPQPDIKNFFKHNFVDGIWLVYPLKFSIRFFSLRHLVPLAFLATMGLFLLLGFLHPFFWWLFLAEVLLHAVMNIYFAIQIAFRERNWKFLFLMPLAFDARQFGYGFGSIFGFIKILLP